MKQVIITCILTLLCVTGHFVNPGDDITPPNTVEVSGTGTMSHGFHTAFSLRPENAFGDTGTTPATASAAPAEQTTGNDVLYRVTGVILIIWIVLGIYLFTIDRKISALERSSREP